MNSQVIDEISVKIYEFYDDNGWFKRMLFVNGQEILGKDIEVIKKKPTLSIELLVTNIVN